LITKGKKMKVIWITGASSGIGEALTYEFNKQGHFIILSARRESELLRVKNNCAFPHKAHLFPFDLEDLDQLKAKTEQVQRAFGEIDVVILNGGLSQRSLAAETDFLVTEKLMKINYFSSVIITKTLLPSFIKNKKGQFVIISSLVGKFGTPYRSSYSASKHALHGYFDSLRAELALTPIKVTIICPGFIKTSISENALTKDGSLLKERDEAQENGMSPERFAQVAAKHIYQGKSEVNIGGKETIGVWLKRLMPKTFEKIISKAKVR
jgi:dehydrogenase/reductase SDR family protein 7B